MRQPSRFVESLEGRSLLSGTISGNVHNDVNGSAHVDESSLTPETVVYLDSNFNGRRDRGEVSTVTDAFGNYRFNDVPGGRHQVKVDLPEGWVPSNAAGAVGVPVIFRGSKDIRVAQMMIRYRTSPWAGVGQNAQHDGISPFRGSAVTQSQEVTQTPSVGQTSDPDPGFKFGTPLFTKYNTAIVPVFMDDGQFAVRAYSRITGFVLWSFVSDYQFPPNLTLSQQSAAAAFQPALDADGRLYVPGAGGTVHLIGAPDRFGTRGGTPTAPTLSIASRRLVFYGKQNYLEPDGKRGERSEKFNKSLFISTGLTVDADGNVYFGVEGPKKNNPLGIGSSLAMVRADGRGARIAAEVVAGSTPALSADERYLYVATQERVKGKRTPRLERFTTGSLTRVGSVVLRDPSRPNKNRPYALREGAFSMPTIAPDGDVYYVVPGTRSAQTDLGNGWLLRFSGDLGRQKMSSLAAEGQTVAIVPADMVSGYRGRSSYVVAATYNAPTVARMALLDPAQAAKKKVNRVAVMRTLKSIVSTTGEWVSRPVAVDPSTKSIFAVNSRTQLVRWNVSDVTDIGASVTLGDDRQDDEGGMSVVIGPDGQVYSIVQGNLYTAF